MIRLSACIEMLFSDLPFVDRISAAADIGIPAFEFWGFPNKDLDAIGKEIERTGLELSAMVCDTGGPLVDPANREGIPAAVETSIGVAKRLDCMTLIVTTGQEIEGVDRAAQHHSIVEGLRIAGPMAADAGITLVLEPLNVLVNHKGYYLATTNEAAEIIDQVNSPAVKILYDIYHQQITEGNLCDTITANINRIGHFHMADVPGRNEPGTGEINYDGVFRAIAATDYDGFVGLELSATVPEKDALALSLELGEKHFG
jgi:hydroxypyruvate isomerase